MSESSTHTVTNNNIRLLKIDKPQLNTEMLKVRTARNADRCNSHGLSVRHVPAFCPDG